MLPLNEGSPISTQCPKCHVVTTTEVTYIANPSCGLVFKILICSLLWLSVYVGMFVSLFHFLRWNSVDDFFSYDYPRLTFLLIVTLGAAGFRLVFDWFTLAMVRLCRNFLVFKEYWGLHACSECGTYIGRSALEDFTPPKQVTQINEDNVTTQV